MPPDPIPPQRRDPVAADPLDGGAGGPSQSYRPPVISRDRTPKEEEDLDMTPMVDVTFLLLIFFMITAAFALQKSIEVPATSKEQAIATSTLEELEEDSVVVRVDSDNVFWVGCPAWPDERRAPSKQDMRAMVRDARRAGGDAKGFSRMLVRASGDATHEFVVAALDAGSAAAVEEIRLLSYEDE
jgi:biopolymer transport protein ExbD